MKDLMSITSLRPCMLISILVFLMTIFFFMNCVVADDAHTRREIIRDLPGKTDFDRYLSALEMVVDFCIRHKYYVDSNFRLGLFLIDVNLRQVLQQKRAGIPADIRSRLEKLLVKNDIVTNYFHLMVQNVLAFSQTAKLTHLFYNTTMWPTPVEKFNVDLLMQTPLYGPEQLKKIYGGWEKYSYNVNHVQNNIPTPSESDACLSYLTRPSSLRWNSRSQPNCLTPPRCKQILQKGSEYGYGQTHRLLYLVIAHFSGRCIVFSEKEDKYRTDMICKKCFSEAEYIASNNFQEPDLLYEHIALCSIFGHAQFIRNYWLKTLLHFQINEGCFAQNSVTGGYYKRQLNNVADQTWQIERSRYILNGRCGGHFTAVAAATLSHTLRYIMETQY